jgi:hypothetical protein
MPSLSLIESEAQRLLRSLEEPQRSEMQQALVELCEIHWQELRGPEPATPLAQVLWSVTPLWADLFIDLYVSNDYRLDVALPRHHLARGMALLVLAEVERGNEAGVQMSHEPMMVFEMDEPPMAWLGRISSLLRGTLAPPLLHPHNGHGGLWKALAVIVAHTRRLDLPAVLGVISLLTVPGESSDIDYDSALEALRQEILETGIRFLSMDDDRVHLEQHGHAHKPVRTREVGEMLLEIRHAWLR